MIRKREEERKGEYMICGSILLIMEMRVRRTPLLKALPFFPPN